MSVLPSAVTAYLAACFGVAWVREVVFLVIDEVTKKGRTVRTSTFPFNSYSRALEKKSSKVFVAL